MWQRFASWLRQTGKNGGWPDLLMACRHHPVRRRWSLKSAAGWDSGGGGQRWVDDGVRDLKGGEVIER